MKLTHAILPISLFALVFASGCVQQPGGSNYNSAGQANPPAPPASPPAAPAGLQPGDWSRVSLTTTSASPVEFMYASVEAAINGTAFSGIETETISGSSLVLWEKGKDRTEPGVRMYSLTKFGQIVLCNAITTEPRNLQGTTDPYAKGGAGVNSLGSGSYTTPTGKTVGVNKYFVQSGGISGEYWYSDGVPFAIVKSETNTTVAGRLVTTKINLQDFGAGATSAFAERDFQKCQ